MGGLTSLLVLSFLIFFHELGHFLVARFFGVHVEVFSIGFGKKMISKVIGKTEYRLSLIPLGGYVKMKGQDDADPTKVSFDSDSYNTKKPWQRIFILLAGPFANFLLAFLLYIAIGSMGVQKLAPHIGKISPASVAEQIGLMENDKIISINGVIIPTWEDVSHAIKESVGVLEFKINRSNEVKTFLVTPKISEYQNIFGETLKKRMLGIAPNGQTIEFHYSVSELFVFATDQTIKSTTLILTSLQKLIEGVVSPKDLGGIISIVQITSDASEAGIVALLALTALISVNLGVLNLLPIPALDGGHIMFNAYEQITQKAPSEKVLQTMTMAGWAFLLTMTVFTIFNDVYRLTNGN